MRLVGVLVVVAALVVAVAGPAEADSFRISQESAAGAGDFDANVLGFVDSYATGLTMAGFYQYGSPNGASYNGELNGGPLPVSSLTQLFLVSASDGLNLVVVHDNPNDGSGGSTDMSLELVGDTAAFTVGDDPGEGLSVSGGGTGFEANHNWIACCTDGFAIGSLDGPWSVFAAFDDLPTGISSWQVTDNDGSSIALVLGAGRQVRIDVVPEPATLALMGLGLAGIAGARRRNKARIAA